MYEIEIYHNSKGKSEVENYIKSLQKSKSKDDKIKINKVIAYIRMLKVKGLALGQPYIKHIDEEIWELRPIKNRILFALFEKNRIVLLSIFEKKTAKTPKAEIKRAKQLLADYKRRKSIDG